MYVASSAWYTYQVCSNDDIGLLLDFLWQIKFALVIAMANCSEPFGNISLHVLAWRHFFFGDVSFHFHDVGRCNVVFSHQNPTKKHLNASVTVKVLGGISCHVMAENWQHLKRKLAFSSVLVC